MVDSTAYMIVLILSVIFCVFGCVAITLTIVCTCKWEWETEQRYRQNCDDVEKGEVQVVACDGKAQPPLFTLENEERSRDSGVPETLSDRLCTETTSEETCVEDGEMQIHQIHDDPYMHILSYLHMNDRLSLLCVSRLVKWRTERCWSQPFFPRCQTRLVISIFKGDHDVEIRFAGCSYRVSSVREECESDDYFRVRQMVKRIDLVFERLRQIHGCHLWEAEVEERVERWQRSRGSGTWSELPLPVRTHIFRCLARLPKLRSLHITNIHDNTVSSAPPLPLDVRFNAAVSLTIMCNTSCEQCVSVVRMLPLLRELHLVRYRLSHHTLEHVVAALDVVNARPHIIRIESCTKNVGALVCVAQRCEMLVVDTCTLCDREPGPIGVPREQLAHLLRYRHVHLTWHIHIRIICDLATHYDIYRRVQDTAVWVRCEFGDRVAIRHRSVMLAPQHLENALIHTLRTAGVTIPHR